MSSSLDTRDRPAEFSGAESRLYDLAVIGGGVTGAGIARDAALRGLSVLLVEARDFASGTSSRSSKMIHGGLRYLPQGDVALVKEAANERQVLRRIAPHLARIAPFIIPTNSKLKVATIRTGMWTFEKLGNVPPDERHDVLDADALAALVPTLRRDLYDRAVRYNEFLTDDARLVVANARDAKAAGATVLNYAKAEELIVEGGKIAGLVARSTLPGESLGARIKAKLVINAAGPWVDAVRALEVGESEPRMVLSRGIHLVFDRNRVPTESTVILRAAGKRGAFLVPHGRFTYLGTTDIFHDSAEYWPGPTRADVAYLLDALTANMDVERPSNGEIVALWSGIRPMVAQEGKGASEVSRKDEIWTSPAGLLTIAGGKLSAYRAMAERVVDMAANRLGMAVRDCETAERPLPGGERAVTTDDRTDQRLIDLYGSEAAVVREHPDGIIVGEVTQAVLYEGAARLEDWWVRRSIRAWFDNKAGRDALPRAADTMAALLGWDERRRDEEIANCLDIDRASRAALGT